MLQRIVCDQLVVHVDEAYSKYLLVPPQLGGLKKNFVLRYLNEREFDISWYTSYEDQSENFMDFLLCVLSLDEREIISLKWNNQLSKVDLSPKELENILKHLNFGNIECLSISHFNMKSVPFEHLHKLTNISLKDCCLAEIPNMSAMPSLDIINVSDNNIRELSENVLPTSMKKVFVDGNPIQCIRLDYEKYPNLVFIQCGSQYTEYIITPLVDRVFRANLKIVVPSNYKPYFCMPPSIVFGDTGLLSSYVQNPEKFLENISNIYKRSAALNWLLNSSRSLVLTIDFTSQRWLSGIKDTLNFQSVLNLTLNDCNLQIFPKLTAMPRLKHLSLLNNHLSVVPTKDLPLLETLNIVKNPIEEIDFDTIAFPNLKLVAFGSD